MIFATDINLRMHTIGGGAGEGAGGGTAPPMTGLWAQCTPGPPTLTPVDRMYY